MEPVYTRVGLIVDGDNRYFGRSTFDGWDRALTASSDAVLVALGMTDLTPARREVARLITLCTMSPDARVWPLKLTRLIASYGDALAGLFGAQLVTAGKVMGPNATGYAARGLAWVAAQAGDGADDAAIVEAVAAWKARAGGRFAGFGVPFRDVDERRTALLRMTAGGPIAQGRHWRLHERVVAAMRPQRPNCAITFAAMLLDVGVAPERVGVATAALMSHVFLAHAVEAAEQDGARAHALPPACVEYRGVAPRTTGRARSR